MTRVRPDFVLPPPAQIDATYATYIIPFSLSDFNDKDNGAVSRSSPS